MRFYDPIIWTYSFLSFLIFVTGFRGNGSDAHFIVAMHVRTTASLSFYTTLFYTTSHSFTNVCYALCDGKCILSYNHVSFSVNQVISFDSSESLYFMLIWNGDCNNMAVQQLLISDFPLTDAGPVARVCRIKYQRFVSQHSRSLWWVTIICCLRVSYLN